MQIKMPLQQVITGVAQPLLLHQPFGETHNYDMLELVPGRKGW